MSTDITTDDFVVVLPFIVDVDDAFPVVCDISAWLVAATISAVAFSAKNAAGGDVSDVFDDGQSGYSSQSFTLYVTGSDTDGSYTVKCKVTDSDGDVKSYFVKFACVTR